MSHPDLVLAVLAAGASRRLGRAKQLISIGGEPVLRRQCRCALDAQLGGVVVILGCNAAQHRRVIRDLPLDVRVNDEWSEGMASTLRCAVDVARGQRAALLVLTCDQYRIVPGDLRALHDQWRRTPLQPCASRAGLYCGPPVILPPRCHADVLALRGDVGARSILHRSPIGEVINPRAAFDLDSAEDVRIAEAWTSAQRDHRLP